MNRSCVAATLVCLLTSSLAAQVEPPGWRFQLDRPAVNVMGRDAPADAWQFREMIPGMHVTSGPGVVVFPATETAAGRFMIDATIVLFPNSGNDGYGVVFGGRSLADASAAWTALLVTADGRFGVFRRGASGREALVDWTPNDAVTRRGAEPVTNQLRVAVEPDSIRFLANGKRLGAIARSAVQPDGQYGLRLDAGSNVHVTNVDVTRRLLKR
jgi:hypothetical protein